MAVKIMVIDGQADFRRLLMHHITTHWPDAIITSYDPEASGHLPENFSGAGNDIVLLGNRQGERAGVDIVRQYLAVPAFPPLVYLGDDVEKTDVLAAGAGVFIDRHAMSHSALIVKLSDLLSKRSQVASTGSLFIGDQATGISPLIRGYRFIRKLNATEHSAVYLAERQSVGTEVVLKVLRQIPDAADSVGAFDRFLQEYELIAELDHPNIVQIHDLGVGDDHAHIAMEYLQGGDLKARIIDGIPEQAALNYFRQISSALAQIHKVGIVHRDLKPANVMLRADDSIALIDFGLAKRMRLRMEMTGSGEIFGTPYYMSPEQGHGNEVDLRSDLYSLGVIFFEMLTGQKPYTGDSAMSIIFKHAKAPIPLLPARLAHYQELLNLMLAKKPEDRLQSADEVPEWL